MITFISRRSWSWGYFSLWYSSSHRNVFNRSVRVLWFNITRSFNRWWNNTWGGIPWCKGLILYLMINRNWNYTLFGLQRVRLLLKFVELIMKYSDGILCAHINFIFNLCIYCTTSAGQFGYLMTVCNRLCNRVFIVVVSVSIKTCYVWLRCGFDQILS